MFDAGEAAQIAYMKSGLGWNKKMKLFVTHLHGDHCVGILGLLQTMSMQNRTESLEIFGPKGIDEFLAANIKVLNFGLPFSILININSEGPGESARAGTQNVARAAPLIAQNAISNVFL